MWEIVQLFVVIDSLSVVNILIVVDRFLYCYRLIDNIPLQLVVIEAAPWSFTCCLIFSAVSGAFQGRWATSTAEHWLKHYKHAREKIDVQCHQQSKINNFTIARLLRDKQTPRTFI